MNLALSLNHMSLTPPTRMPAMSLAQARLRGLEQPGSEKPADILAIPGQRNRNFDTYECQTCKNRTYQDGSDDLGVSFKTPTKLSPEQAAYAVRSHEAEHVARAWSTAQKENKEVVSQTVTYRTGVCPECGKTYIAGGNTRTVFRAAPETYEREPEKKGVYIDMRV